MGVCLGVMCLWKLEINFMIEFILSFLYMGFGIKLRLHLPSKCLYLLSHLVSPNWLFLIFFFVCASASMEGKQQPLGVGLSQIV